jgi:hypothetical protein
MIKKNYSIFFLWEKIYLIKELIIVIARIKINIKKLNKIKSFINNEDKPKLIFLLTHIKLWCNF